ncbi:uncharacterized protein SOCE26_100700 [Sorangium cellulosum]|uniref:Uncharacterized protein n=1 Tax=Sorangium cellulosum TaxID=56 RepID=A0A2L0FAN0_SORCE|nr:hypothetical protein [Sorangium cellulosum]AUX48532.1 uncharacterized protein SOCE26_100700 [Sorangium cellulosum]
MPRPEDAARKNIDDALTTAGWAVQDRRTMNLDAARGVAVREFPLKRGHGFADYLLYVDGEAVGVIEAKEVGTTLTGVEGQTEKYSVGLPAFCRRRCGPYRSFTSPPASRRRSPAASIPTRAAAACSTSTSPRP